MEENSVGSVLLGPEEQKACGQEARGAIWILPTPLSRLYLRKLRRAACAGLQPRRGAQSCAREAAAGTEDFAAGGDWKPRVGLRRSQGSPPTPTPMCCVSGTPVLPATLPPPLSFTAALIFNSDFPSLRFPLPACWAWVHLHSQVLKFIVFKSKSFSPHAANLFPLLSWLVYPFCLLAQMPGRDSWEEPASCPPPRLQLAPRPLSTCPLLPHLSLSSSKIFPAESLNVFPAPLGQTSL